jgi:(2Fe-2S) ferredoxin
MSRHIILVGRALGAPTAERTLNDLARRLSLRARSTVRAALLDHGERSLHDALDECRADGAAEVLVIPAQVPRDRYLESWVGKAAAHWAEARAERNAPGAAERRGGIGWPPVRIGVGVSETDSLVDALVAAAELPGRLVTESPVSFRSPKWSTIGGHRHQVLVCRGPRCSAHGSSLVAQALATKLQDGPVGYEEVLVTNTGCLVPCNLGPILVVQPDDVWYTSVDPAGVERIVDEHLDRGTVVEDLRTARADPSSGHAPSAAIFHTAPEET